jgi:hypothetical protein
MPPPQRVRYNAAARKSVAGGSSHKKRGKGPRVEAGAGSATPAVVEDDVADAGATAGGSSFDIVARKTAEDKERDRKERMRAEVRQEACSRLGPPRRVVQEPPCLYCLANRYPWSPALRRS